MPRYAITITAAEAKAQWSSGNWLWDDACREEDKNPVKGTICFAYLMGAIETFGVLAAADQVKYFCVPPNVEKGQMMDVVKLYLRDHPETRQYHAPTLVMLALKEKFPCQKRTRRTMP